MTGTIKSQPVDQNCHRAILQRKSRYGKTTIGQQNAGMRKLRQGNFEVKGLTVAPQTILLSADAAGLYDSWIKWSLNADGVTAFGKAMCADAATIVVGKTRWLRRISLDEASPREVDATAHPHAGCNVELTAITVGDRSWWSLGFEAFGQRDRTADHLFRGAGHFFAANPPPCRLRRADAMSYPVWLAGLA